MLAPDQPGAPAEHGQIHELDGRAVLDRHVTTAARARRSRFAGLDMHSQRLTGDVGHGEHGHLRESDQQLAHARRVQLPQGLSRTRSA